MRRLHRRGRNVQMKTLVLLHGFPFDSSMWNEVKRFIPSTVKVITPDLRGVNRSLSIGAPPSLDIIAEDILSMIDSHGIKDIYLAGMSMGGYVALAFAEKFRTRLSGLGLLNTHASADTPDAKTARFDLINKVKRDGIKAAIDVMLPRVFSEQIPEWKDYMLRGSDKAGADGICWMLEAMAYRPDRNNLLGTISVPSLVIHGEKDISISEQRSRDLVKCLPFGQFVMIQGAGHASPIEAPKKVASALLSWCER